MNKRDILEISRETLKDEEIEYCESKGIKYGYIIFSLLYIFFVIIDLIYGERSTFYALTSLFLVFIASRGYVKWQMFKSKMYFIQMICGGIAAALFAIKYLLVLLM